MKITYDKSVDAAYIYFDDNKLVDKTIPVEWIDGMINIDFSDTWEIVWIEIISGSKFLTQDVLSSAELIN